MTNDEEAARAFWDQHSGEVIYKHFIALPDTWHETQRLYENDMVFAQAIRFAPVIFERHILAVADFRVIVIGDTLFAAAADVRTGGYP